MSKLFIKWENSVHQTGLDIIDEQHRALVSLINSFYYHKNDPFIERILVPTALMTINMAKIHFITEEQLMEQSAYPELEAHSLAHEHLFSRLIKVERESRRDRDAERFLDFLKSWWADHVNKFDRRYIPHLKEYFGDRV